MPENENGQSITRILRDVRAGHPDAESELWALAYDELKCIARRQLGREYRHRGLKTTALVHEAYLRLVNHQQLKINDGHHFYALAARMMRRHLVDRARQKDALKRGGGETPQQLIDQDCATGQDCLAELDLALVDLARIDSRKAAIVELRFFGGYSITEIADMMQCSTKTVQRQWNTARVWLYSRLHDEITDQGAT